MSKFSSDAITIAEEFSKAFAERNVAGIERLYADDILVRHNHEPERQNKEENLAFVSQFFQTVSSCFYDNPVRTLTEYGVVQEHLVRGVYNNGQLIPPTPVCMIFKLRDGLIVELAEYLNLAPHANGEN